jgi:hypothetical protein
MVFQQDDLADEGSMINAMDRSISTFGEMKTDELDDISVLYNEIFAAIGVREINFGALRRSSIEKFSAKACIKFAIILQIRGPNCVARSSDARFRATVEHEVQTSEGAKTVIDLNNWLRISGFRMPHFMVAFADLISLALLKSRAPKKNNDSALPAHLQFLSATSLPMSRSLTELHKEFCSWFESQVNSNVNAQRNRVFNETLHDQIVSKRDSIQFYDRNVIAQLDIA